MNKESERELFDISLEYIMAELFEIDKFEKKDGSSNEYVSTAGPVMTWLCC